MHSFLGLGHGLVRVGSRLTFDRALPEHHAHEATLPIPGADIVRAIKASWQEQKRKVDVMLILDRSGSMQDDIGGVSKIDGAKQGLQEFVKLLSNNDQLGLTIFSDSADVISPITRNSRSFEKVLKRL